MQRQVSEAKGKAFSKNPHLLQLIADALKGEFKKGAVVSRPLPCREGDYHILFTIYEEA